MNTEMTAYERGCAARRVVDHHILTIGSEESLKDSLMVLELSPEFIERAVGELRLDRASRRRRLRRPREQLSIVGRIRQRQTLLLQRQKRERAKKWWQFWL